jgi:hypothetical protein
MKRVLNEDGSFSKFMGKTTLPSTPRKTVEQKIKERGMIEQTAANIGVSPDNPAQGGLSDDDKEKIKGGMLDIQGMMSLAILRDVAVPTKSDWTAKSLAAHLLGETEDLDQPAELTEEIDLAFIHDKKTSLVQLKKIAKANAIKLPARVTKSKAVEIITAAVNQSLEQDDDL